MLQNSVDSTSGRLLLEESMRQVSGSSTRSQGQSNLITVGSSPQRRPLAGSFAEVADVIKKQTLLAPQEIEHLHQANPGLMAWLQSGSGFMMQVILFALFVGVDAGKALFASNALKGTTVIPSSLVIASSALSIVVGIAVAAAADGTEGARMAIEWQAVKKFALVAILFAFAQTFQALSYTMLSTAMIKTFNQVRLPQTAILSVLFMKRSYSIAQWSVMAIVVLGALIFAQAGMEDNEAFNLRNIINRYMTNQTNCNNVLEGLLPSGTITTAPESCSERLLEDWRSAAQEAQMLLGLLYVLITCFLFDLASILWERGSKDDAGTPFYVQKVACELSGFPTAIAMSVFMPYLQLMLDGDATDVRRVESSMWWKGEHMEPPKGGEMTPNWLFQGWGSGAYLALVFSCVGSWLSGLVVKRMSSVMKLLGKVVSLAFVYFIGDCWFMRVPGRDIPLNKTLGQFIVMAATFSFLNLPPPEKGKEAPPKKSEAAPHIQTAGSETELHPLPQLGI